MKAQIIRSDMEVVIAHAARLYGHEFIGENTTAMPGRRGALAFKPGTVLDHPQAYRLVQQGCAIPADEECRAKAGLSDEEIAVRQQHYERLSRGIDPEDYDLYDAGVIAGYDEEDTEHHGYKPGQNWKLFDTMRPASDNDDEDEPPKPKRTAKKATAKEEA